MTFFYYIAQAHIYKRILFSSKIRTILKKNPREKRKIEVDDMR